MRLIDWIWHIKGSVSLPAGQSNDEAFDRLDPLFRQSGTSHERTDDTLEFRKHNPAAQDKMSIFDRGVLQIDRGIASSVLHYHMSSRALLFCFLAPLLFLGFAQLTVAIGKYQQSSADDSDQAEKADKKDKVLPQHPIDKALGAPKPEKPKKDKDKSEEDDDKPSPTPAYVFAALFAALYVIGRIVEDKLIKSLFKKRLLGV